MPLSLADVKVLDRNAEALGVSVRDLMENAGRAVADRVREETRKGPILVLAGPGNNGGDGLVAARHLANHYDVHVLTPAVDREAFKTELARRALDHLPERVAVTYGADGQKVQEALRGRKGVVLDALLGAGLRGNLREPYAGIVRAVNEAGVRVFSVDVPTGLGAEPTIRPDATVTFHDVKEGMSDKNSGRIHVADIGIPEKAATYTGPGEFALYPKVPWEQHKGEGGVVLVLGGGPYTGAPAVAGLASLRAGADLGIILTPERAWQAVANYSPNLVVRPLSHDDLDFEDPGNRVTLNMWLRKADSLVIGPGLGLFDITQKSVQHAVTRARREGKPMVLDADALTALHERRDLLGPDMVVTPHAREFRVLTGHDLPDPRDLEKRAELARLTAAETGTTFLLKGPVDVITDGDRVKFNESGHPGMSVGGTGDALAGIVGALLAKGMRPFDAARLGAYLSGLAGRRAARTYSYGMVATDVVDAIGPLLAEHRAGE